MNNEKRQKLKSLLENISDSYGDFINGTLRDAEKSEDTADKIIAFIELHPKATSSDVIKFETEEIFGIKPLI